MSGFLKRLAERAVGTSRLVEPRLRSRFEPDAPFRVASPMQVDEFLDVMAADLRRPGAEPRPPSPAGRAAPAGGAAATVSTEAHRRSTPATKQLRGSAPGRARPEEVAAQAVAAPLERGDEPVFPPGARATEPLPAGQPADVGATTDAPQLAARIGRSHAFEPDQPFGLDRGVQAPRNQAEATTADAGAHEPQMDRTASIDRRVIDTELEVDDLVFVADISSSASRSLDSAAPAGQVRDAMERDAPAAPTHVRLVRTSRHEVRRPATGVADGDYDSGPTDRPAIEREGSTHRIDGAESMRFEHRADREPVVHVRIGRIDVRAAAPPAPAVPMSTQPRVESLDDYLKRTSGHR